MNVYPLLEHLELLVIYFFEMVSAYLAQAGHRIEGTPPALAYVPGGAAILSTLLCHLF